MDKHEILRHLDGFCPDFTLDDERYVYTDNIFVCGMEVSNGTITVFYPYRNKERCDVYPVRNYDDIIDIWSEYRYRLKRCQQQLVQS